MNLRDVEYHDEFDNDYFFQLWNTRIVAQKALVSAKYRITLSNSHGIFFFFQWMSYTMNTKYLHAVLNLPLSYFYRLSIYNVCMNTRTHIQKSMDDSQSSLFVIRCIC